MDLKQERRLNPDGARPQDEYAEAYRRAELRHRQYQKRRSSDSQ
jgi:hypothetical protein